MKRKLILVAQSILCILLVILLSVTAVGIYRDGAERKAENPLEWIYTRERAEEGLSRIVPLFWLCVGVTAVGLLLGIRDDDADKMARDIRVSRALKSSHPLQEKTKGDTEDERLTRSVRIIVLGAAVVFIVLGALNGGARDMLYKAVKICTECVGLG